MAFSQFEIEYNPSCTYDRLGVYLNPSKPTPPLDVLCGDTPPSHKVYPTNTLYLEFSSDNSVTKAGFTLTVTALGTGVSTTTTTTPPGNAELDIQRISLHINTYYLRYYLILVIRLYIIYFVILSYILCIVVMFDYILVLHILIIIYYIVLC